MEKLEVGQYWHRLEDGMEWIIRKEIAGDYFACECTKQAFIWVVSDVGNWNYEELIECGYVLGRHPENIEQWQPKEGDLVWVKGRKNQGNIFHSPTKGKIVEFEGSLYAAWKPSKHSTTLTTEPLLFLELEPYTDQDKKIDFSVAGQWLRWGRTIFKTNGLEDEGCFFGSFLGDGLKRSSKISKKVKWQLLTPEQVQPLLDAIKGLTESQND